MEQKLRCIQTKWYVADTPGPAILGLPTSERLKVITLNCAVRITHESPRLWIQNHIIWLGMMVPHHIQWHRLLRVDIHLQRSNLFKDYPNHFEGIGRFPGTYKIT